MGDTGPCGPCSEIHIDLRPDEERARVNGLELINKNHPQVIEIWNLVFMQYNRRADSSLDALPHKVIDTGMGFERLCMAIQGKTSNYDTDVFQPLISTLATMSGIRYGDDASTDIAMRVVADHIRTIAFAITDGQLPSNAKAGYVIRRILRRAVRYGYTFLHCREAFMYRLLPTLIDTMGDAYPELQAQRELIGRVIKEEEESFLRTLETGIRLLDKKIAENKAAGSTTLRGTDAFELYDTFGFPLDLTALILAENGMTVDEAGFGTEMQKQKERARNAAAMEAGDWVVIREGESKFSGYDFTETETEILRYRLVKQKNKEYYQVVLWDTPLYAEMGGQVGDSGQLIDESGVAYDIFDTKRENNLPVHLMKKLPESTTDTFVARIHEEKRRQAEANHTATHLMHEALRDVLGTHVEQKGSFVSPEVLRFDFSHFGKMSVEEIRKVEELVAQRIRADYRREEFRDVPIAEAQAMGAMALFGEKYGEEVRVMKYGSSVELCGGTHIPSTGMIGTFRIVSESSIASGIRRIEAVTGANAERLTYEREDILLAIKELFNNNPNLIKSIEKMLEEDVQLKKQVADMKQERIARFKKTLLEQDIRRRGIRVFAIKELMQTEMMKDLAFQIAGEMTESFAIVAGTIESENKCALTVMLSKDLVESGMDAAKLVRNAAGLIQGGGGGQPHFATAGGKKSEGIHAAIEQILKEADLAN